MDFKLRCPHYICWVDEVYVHASQLSGLFEGRPVMFEQYGARLQLEPDLPGSAIRVWLDHPVAGKLEGELQLTEVAALLLQATLGVGT
jgi:hypothetical protein